MDAFLAERGPGAASYSCKVVFNRQPQENGINDLLKEQPGLFVRETRTLATWRERIKHPARPVV